MSWMWIHSWPKSEGLYWLHGWLYLDQQLKDPNTYLVKARKDSSGNLICSTEGVILRESEGCRGVWVQAQAPIPPHGIKL